MQTLTVKSVTFSPMMKIIWKKELNLSQLITKKRKKTKKTLKRKPQSQLKLEEAISMTRNKKDKILRKKLKECLSRNSEKELTITSELLSELSE